MFFSLHRNVIICVQWTSLIPQRLFINQAGQICLFLLSGTSKTIKLCSLSVECRIQVCSLQYSMFDTKSYMFFCGCMFGNYSYIINDGISFCYVIALFHLAFPFCYSLHNISVRKPFDMSNDTKKNNKGKVWSSWISWAYSVSTWQKRTHIHSCCSQSQKLSHARAFTHTSLNVSPVKHSLVWPPPP